jgi:hypothetical protein
MEKLRQQYLQQKRIVYISQNDICCGTCTLDQPCLYVLTSDLCFDAPPPSAAQREANPALANGWPAALMVVGTDIVLDLAGYTVSQSPHHYLTQRFFALVALSDHLFASGAGPPRLNQVQHVRSAHNALVMNGTLGLSSHHGVYGNQTCNVVLHQLAIQDYEVAAIQLNGPHNALIDHCRCQALCFVPFTPATSTLMIHAFFRDGLNPTLEAAVTQLVATWDESAATARAEGLTVPELLRRAAELTGQRLCCPPTCCLWELVHNTHGRIDGSAVYGVLVHSAKPAVGALSEACCTADRGRPFDNVALLDVTVTHLNLQSTESALCQPEGGKPEVDSTGALLELGASELMRQVQGAGAGACPVQRQNVDIMGHQAKGIMAVRLDNGSRALVRRLTVRCLENSSRRTAVVAPNRSAEAAVDSAMGTAFGATYIRGVVVAGVRSACLDTVSLEQLHSPYGVIKGVELLGARDVTVRCVTMRDLSGFYVCGCYIQSSCGNVKVAGLRLDSAVATLPAEFGEWERWLPLRRDPQVLAVEAGAGTVVVTETDQLAEG